MFDLNHGFISQPNCSWKGGMDGLVWHMTLTGMYFSGFELECLHRFAPIQDIQTESDKNMVPQRKNRGLFPREERDIQSRQNETIGHSQDNYLKFYLSPETILLVPYLPLPTQNSSLLLLYPILQSHQAACFWNMPYFFMSLPLHMLFLISRILAKFLFIFPGISFNCLLLCNKLL